MLLKTEIEAFKNDGTREPGMYTAYVDFYASERYGGRLIFASFVMANKDAGPFARSFGNLSRLSFHMNYRYYPIDMKQTSIESQKVGEYTHFILRYKSGDEERTDEQMFSLYENFAQDEFPVNSEYADVPENVVKEVADCIMQHTAVPFVREWAPYVAKELLKVHAFYYAQLTGEEGRAQELGFKSILLFYLQSSDIKRILKFGLQSGDISIDGCNEVSERFKEASQNIYLYQSEFGQELADHTTEVFKPAFMPKMEKVDKRVDDFYDVAQFYDPQVKKYVVQKHVVEAARRKLQKENTFLLEGEPGAGKTLMGIAITDTSAWRPDYSVVVVAPSRLVGQWRDEIKLHVPMSEVMLVESMSDFLKAEKELKNPLRMRSLWVIMSNYMLKTSYNEHPAVVWSDIIKGYVCPHCGQPIAVKKVVVDDGRNDNAERYQYAGPEDFFLEPDDTKDKGKKDRRYCTYAFDADGNVFDKNGKPNGCGTKVWEASTRENSAGGCQSDVWDHRESADKAWIKIPKMGWIQKDRIEEEKESLDYRIANWPENMQGKQHYKDMVRWRKAIADYESKGAVMQYPHNYSIAKYMKKHLNKAFDFGIFDECHNFKEDDSKQGDAFCKAVNAVKKRIMLTGTFSDGYAKGLFHILFCTQTHNMIADGYGYKMQTAFQNKYGVNDEITIHRGELNSSDELVNYKKRSHKKAVPGISPTVTADYLMNSMVAVTKADIAGDDLCGYTETPLGIEMDTELEAAYRQIVGSIATMVTTNRGENRRVDRRRVRNALMTASMFLDQPFGLDTADEDGYDAIELSPETVRPKEQALIDLAAEKKADGEKMLVYVQYTQKTDIPNRLCRILGENDITAKVMGAGVKPRERSSWLAKQAANDVDVVIMNPALVSEGLNLLDYTTIVFYEVGNDVTKIRQASKRSDRINQTKDVSVYFLFYKGTVQEDTIGLISQKMKAAKAVEGDFSSSALQDMTDDNDALTKLVNSIVKDEHIKVQEDGFALASKDEDKEKEKDANAADTFVEAANDVHFIRRSIELTEPENTTYISMCA